ncbi:hypothetical protein DL771_010068 [Monosporascus sp. 5C6A]|nr:hypothetical protein DL771_010068 [Monosporascus sp. 5C6A]
MDPVLLNSGVNIPIVMPHGGLQKWGRDRISQISFSLPGGYGSNHDITINSDDSHSTFSSSAECAATHTENFHAVLDSPPSKMSGGKKQRNMSPQGTNDDRGSDEPKKRVKRPMNAYMVFRQAVAPGIRAENPKFKNGELSKEAGREGSEMPKAPRGQCIQGQTAQSQISPINFGLPYGYANERHGFSLMNIDPFLLKSGVNDPFANQDDVLNDSHEVSSLTTLMDIFRGVSTLDSPASDLTDQNEVAPTNPIFPNDYEDTSSGMFFQTDLDGPLLNDAMDFDSFDTVLDLSLLDWNAY